METELILYPGRTRLVFIMCLLRRYVAFKVLLEATLRESLSGTFRQTAIIGLRQ